MMKGELEVKAHHYEFADSVALNAISVIRGALDITALGGTSMMLQVFGVWLSQEMSEADRARAARFVRAIADMVERPSDETRRVVVDTSNEWVLACPMFNSELEAMKQQKGETKQ